MSITLELEKLYDKYIELSNKKNLSGQQALQAVKQNRYAFRHVNNQTRAICLQAVKKDGYALRYVNKQTEAICLQAVKKDGDALKYVKHQTETICLQAVRQNGHALKYVSDTIFEDIINKMTKAERLLSPSENIRNSIERKGLNEEI